MKSYSLNNFKLDITRFLGFCASKGKKVIGSLCCQFVSSSLGDIKLEFMSNIYVYGSLKYTKNQVNIEASRGAKAQSVTVKLAGCGCDPHSKR